MITQKKQALLFLLLIGIISLLADFTHEGARSIYGPYLGLLGVSAFMVSFTAGLGEFIGQSLRIVTGIIADKTKQYWLMMFIGYAINLLVIPLLYFVQPGFFEVAIILILLERVGKGIRAPAKSVLTSFVSPHLGAGKTFALQEMMDQLGAFLGPLFVFIVLSINKGSELNGYQISFGLLGIFSIMTLVVILVARLKYPTPDHFEVSKHATHFRGNKAFLIYLVAIAFIALGFIDYPFMAYHIKTFELMEIAYVPLLYAYAMGIDAISALIFGILFDKIRVNALLISMLISMGFSPIFFLNQNLLSVIIGVTLWGIGMGALESILKAVISTSVSKDKRATAYGIFYTVFGLSWFIGSSIVGGLYGISIEALVIFSVSMEILGVIMLFVYQKAVKDYINDTVNKH